jgi:predicted DNA-binding transcriptional regulator AlpA
MNTDTHPSTPVNAQPVERLIDTKEAMRQSSMSRTFVLTNQGFPKPVKAGRATRFIESEVQAWISARKAARG